MTWVVYSLLSLTCFVFFNLLNRVVAVKSEVPRAGSFVFNIWGGLSAIVLFMITSKTKINFQPLTNPITGLLVLSSVLLYAFYERLQFTVNKNIDASTASILFRLSPAFTFIFSILLLKEGLTLYKAVGAALILCGNLIIVLKGDVLKLNKYTWLGIVCTMLIGTAWIVDKVVSSRLNSDFYTLILWVAPIPIIFLPYISLKVIKNELILGSWKAVVMAILNVVGFYFQIVALSKGEASRVIPIISSSSVLVVLLAVWWLKERSHVGKKILAVLFATAGVLLLSR